ncbi:hypothetical protein DFH06DRAFT_1237085 [Mycena polygramma]|nr:hypothetical protein DFH06DRAFT_1237085 [Mycena polygramma]
MPRSTTFIIETTGGAPVFHIPVPISLLGEHENVKFVFRNFGGTPTFHVGGADVGVGPGEAYDYATTTVAVMRERRIKLEREGQELVMLEDGVAASGPSSEGTPQVRMKLEEETPRVPKRSKGKEKAREHDAEGDAGQGGSTSAFTGASNTTDAVPSSPEEVLALQRGSLHVDNFAEVYEQGRQDFALRCAPSQPSDRALTSDEEKEWRLLWEAVLVLDRENWGPTRDPDELKRRSEEMIVAAARRARRQTQAPLPDTPAQSNSAEARSDSTAAPPTDKPPAVKQRVRRPVPNDVTNDKPPPKNGVPATDVQAAKGPLDQPGRAQPVKVGGKPVNAPVQGGEPSRGPKERARPPNTGANLTTHANEKPVPGRVSGGNSGRGPAQPPAMPAAKAPLGDVATTNPGDGNAAAHEDPGAARRFIDALHTRLEKPAPQTAPGVWAAVELERRKASGAVEVPASRSGDAAPRPAAMPARTSMKTKLDAEAARAVAPTDAVVQPARQALPSKAIPPSSRPAPMPARTSAKLDAEAGGAAAQTDAVVESTRRALAPLHAEMRDQAQDKNRDKIMDSPQASSSTNSPSAAAIVARNLIASRVTGGRAGVRPPVKRNKNEKEASWPPVRGHGRGKEAEREVKENAKSVSLRGDSDSAAPAGSKRSADAEGGPVNAKRPRLGATSEMEKEPPTPKKSTRSGSVQTPPDAESGKSISWDRALRPTVPDGLQLIVAAGTTHWAWGLPDNDKGNPPAVAAKPPPVVLLTQAECAWLARQEDLARTPDWWRPVKWLELGERMWEAHKAGLPVRPLHHGLLHAAWDRGEWRFAGVGHERVGRVGMKWMEWILSKEGQAWRAGK